MKLIRKETAPTGDQGLVCYRLQQVENRAKTGSRSRFLQKGGLPYFSSFRLSHHGEEIGCWRRTNSRNPRMWRADLGLVPGTSDKGSERHCTGLMAQNKAPRWPECDPICLSS